MHPLGQHQGLLHIVGDQQHREASALPELQQKILHGLTNLQIQGAKGLIEEQHLGIGGQGAGDGDPLLHSARELTGQLSGCILQTHHLEEVGGALFDVALRQALQAHAKGNVLSRTQPRVEAVFLKNHAAIRARTLNGLSIHQHLP